MNARDYLQQGFYLDKKIESNLREVAELRNLCMGISAAGLEESHNPNQPTEAPFVRTIEKIWEREQEINKEIDRLVDLKYEIGKVIDQVEDESPAPGPPGPVHPLRLLGRHRPEHGQRDPVGLYGPRRRDGCRGGNPQTGGRKM